MNALAFLIIGLILGLLSSPAFFEQISISRTVGRGWRRWVQIEQMKLAADRAQFESDRSEYMHLFVMNSVALFEEIEKAKAAAAAAPVATPIHRYNAS